jgi:putative DNA primase/helicase
VRDQAAKFEEPKNMQNQPHPASAPPDARIVAHARDVHSGEYFAVVTATSLEGKVRRIHIPLAELAARGENALLAALGKAGCAVPIPSAERRRFLAGLGAVPPGPALPLCTRPGWAAAAGHEDFVGPFGWRCHFRTSTLKVDTRAMLPAAYERSGTLEEWRRHVAAPLRGNSTAMFAVMAAFVGPGLSPLGEEPFGFHLVGPTSIGKSTIVLAACSVWGGGPGKLGFGRSWLLTVNGLEELQRVHRDGFLGLDEAALAGDTPAECGRVILHAIYRLANAEDKVRKGSPLPAVASRLVFLGSSEHWLDEHAAQAGLKVNPGQRVRLLEIDADAGLGLGVWERLAPSMSASDFSDRRQRMAHKYNGTAIQAFLPRFLADLHRDRAALLASIHADVRAFAAAVGVDGADGPRARAAKHFGLVYAFGALAIRYGILPWTEAEALDAAVRCWERTRLPDPAPPPQSPERSIAAVRGHIEEHLGEFLRVKELGSLTKEQLAAAPGAVYPRRGGGREFVLVS